MTPRRPDLDEREIAQRLSIGDSMRLVAVDLGCAKSSIAARVGSWRKWIAAQLDDQKEPAAVIYWLRDASAARVARRWLWLTTQDPRSAPMDHEPH